MNLLPSNILKCLPAKERKSLGKAGMLPEEIEAKVVAKSEKALQNDIANLLRRHGIWFDQDAMCRKRTGTKGTPDFLFALKGQAVAIEAKLPGQKPRPDQEAAHAAMRKNGWRVEVVTDIQQAVDLFVFEGIVK